MVSAYSALTKSHPFCLCAGTDTYIQDVITAVKEVGELACGNMGKLWHKLKVTPGSCPPWEKLKEAAFWKNATRYQRLWDQLAGSVNRPGAQLHAAIGTESGEVKTGVFDLVQDGKPVQKVAAWATSLAPLVSHRKMHVLWVEVGSGGLPGGIADVIEHHKDCRLILVGTDADVVRAMLDMGKLKESHPTLYRYKTSMLSLHLKEDPPLGSRQPPHVNVTRRVLLASPTPLRPHRNYMSMDYGWRTSVLLQMLAILDVPPMVVFTTICYVPHLVRPDEDIISKAGHVLGQLERWQISFVLASDATGLDVLANLKSVVQASHAGMEQTIYEKCVLARGATLNAMTIVPPPARAGTSVPWVTNRRESSSSIQTGAEAPAAKSAAKAPEGSPEGGAKARAGFKAPKRKSDASALDERSAAGKTRSAAVQQEADAEKVAESAAKKARSESCKTPKKGKKTKKHDDDHNEPLDFEGIPEAD